MKNIGNPFVECTSRDMSFKEVFEFWCDPFTCYAINSDTLQRSMTPVIVEGPRGSGKTMILKYISYFCQKELFNSNAPLLGSSTILDHIIKKGSVGIYFRYKDDFDSLFNYLNCSKSSKEQLFLYYFEMYVLDEIIKVLGDLFSLGTLTNEKTQVFIDQMNILLSESATSFNDLLDCIRGRISRVDKWIQKSRYIDQAENSLHELIDGDGFIQETCKRIISAFPEFRLVKFLIIIDEYENAGEYQRLLNTLIKQVDHTSNVTYRIGVRPKGITTLDTNVANESLQIDRDFLLYVLQSQKMTDYKDFVEQVANRRLINESFYKSNGLTNIKELLGTIENLDAEACAVVKNSRKHFDILKKKFKKDEYRIIIKEISNPTSPLMEMLNILWVLRGIPYERVKVAMCGYLSGKYRSDDNSEETILSQKYKLDYSDKYRFQLLFILLGIYSQAKKYYSFNTFCYLSSGAVNDFISICRNVFYLLDETYFDKCQSNKMIPVAAQAKGAELTAIEQMDKIRLCNEHGLEMYSFAMNMGELFKSYHRDIYARYPETTQFAFENEIEIENRPLLNSVRNSLIKWGVIVKRPRIQSISIGRRKGSLYYLNRMFCPIFGISYRTRGGFNYVLHSELFEKLLKEQMDAEQIKSWRAIHQLPSSGESKPTEKADRVHPNQMSLFEEM